MLTYELLTEIADGAGAISDRLYCMILRRIIRRFIARMNDYEPNALGGTDYWQMKMLTEAGYLMEDIQKDIATATGLQEAEIRKLMEYAGAVSFDADSAVYQAAGILEKGVDITQYPQYLNIMQRSYTKTISTWRNFTATTASEAYKLFITECDMAHQLVMSGAVSYTEAYVSAIKRISKNTLTITYNNGIRPHRDTIETATLRAVRTGTAQACGDISIARMDDLHWDTVLVSAHMGARCEGDGAANHALWQGKMYSRSGRDRRFPAFAVCGYGTGEGLCGWNCRHSFAPSDGKHNPFDGLIDRTENKKAYELSQQQRAIERRIRRTKNECIALREGIDGATGEAKAKIESAYQRKAATLSAQNAKYNAFCVENGLHRYDDRLKTARWDREQAAKARGAAARYRNAHRE